MIEKRKKKRVSINLSPELYKQVKDSSINISAAVESYLAQLFKPAMLDNRVPEQNPALKDLIKSQLVPFQTRRDVSPPVIVAEDDGWQPGDKKRAARVQHLVCRNCSSLNSCKQPCGQYRRAYEASV